MSLIGVEIKFFSKANEFPVVNTAVKEVDLRYKNAKNSSPLLRFYLNTVEKGVRIATVIARPFVMPFNRSISFVDTIACHGLEQIEQKFPSTKLTLEEMRTAVDTKCEEIKQYGRDKVNAVKEYGYSKYDQILSTLLVRTIVTSMDTSVDLLERFVKFILPAAEDEESIEIKGNVFQRIFALSTLARFRIHHMMLLYLEKLQTSVTGPLVERALNLIKSPLVRIKWFLEEINKTDSESDYKGYLLSLARGVVQRIKYFGAKVVERLPDRVREGGEQFWTYLKSEYEEIESKQTVKEMLQVVYKHIILSAKWLYKDVSSNVVYYIRFLLRCQLKSD